MSTFNRLFLVVAVSLVPAFAVAHDSTPRIDERQDNQAARIQDGVENGELTYRESRRLVRGQARVNRLERRALADNGTVGAIERLRIEKAQDRQSRRIRRQKHDRQGR